VLCVAGGMEGSSADTVGVIPESSSTVGLAATAAAKLVCCSQQDLSTAALFRSQLASVSIRASCYQHTVLLIVWNTPTVPADNPPNCP
jgi:hypothetical protein